MHSSPRPPNIILINCDDLGYGDLGCYGSTCHHTPAIDQLAREGMRFTHFSMAASVCTPSRGAMLTGCYPSRIGLAAFDWDAPVLLPGASTGLNPDEETIASLLQQQGYATKLVGKWHLGDQPEFLPTKHGFDEYFGLPYSNDMGVQPYPGWRGAKYPPLPVMRDSGVIEEQPDQSQLTARYVDECRDFIRRKADQPFFLYFAHMYVHVPLYVPEAFLDRSQNGRYGAAVECIDWATAELMKELKALGLDDNTLVIFTSDNGSLGDGIASNGELRGSKYSPWEGGFRVPCIMRWPGKIADGATYDGLANAMDFLPTLASIAGANRQREKPIDGHDLSETILRQAPTPREDFAYYKGDTLVALRSGDWKLHVHHDDGPVSQLYHLRDDPGETNDVVAKHPNIVEALQRQVEDYRTRLGDRATSSIGSECREPGRVNEPCELTIFDPSHPYFAPEYDLPNTNDC